MKKLISTDGLNLELDKINMPFEKKWKKTVNNTCLVKRKLELGYFIATDKEGNVLEEPEHYKSFLKVRRTNKAINDECKQYQEAKERVLFKGFTYEYLSDSELYIKCLEFGIFYDIANDKFTYSGDESDLEIIQDLIGLDIELFNTLKQ